MPVKYFILFPPSFAEDDGRFQLASHSCFKSKEAALVACEELGERSEGFWAPNNILVVRSC